MAESFTFASIFILGCFHALEPGHGKTFLLAYTIGQKLDLKKIIILTISLLFSHLLTLSIFAILFNVLLSGIADKFLHNLSHWFVPSIILLFGIYIIARAVYKGTHEHNNDCVHEHGKFPDSKIKNTLSVGLLSTVAGRSTEDRDKVFKIIKSMELEGIAKILPTLKTRWFTDHFIKNNPSIVEKRIKQVIDTNPEVFLNVFKIYAETEMITWLKNIKKPCLVMTGENDLGCSPNHNQKIATQLQNSQLVILPKVKHSILLENPDTVSSEILNFLLNL